MSNISQTINAYEFVREKLKDCDPDQISSLAGVGFNAEKQEFNVSLMGRSYLVVFPSGDVYLADHSHFHDPSLKTLLLRYLINARGTPPAGREISYRDIPGGGVYYRNFAGRCIQRLARMFGSDFSSLEKAMAKLNAVRIEQGDIGYRFQFINNVYVTLILWRGDDEFPPMANILFDANAGDYFDAEDLAVVGDISLNVLKRL